MYVSFEQQLRDGLEPGGTFGEPLIVSAIKFEQRFRGGAKHITVTLRQGTRIFQCLPTAVRTREYRVGQILYYIGDEPHLVNHLGDTALLAPFDVQLAWTKAFPVDPRNTERLVGLAEDRLDAMRQCNKASGVLASLRSRVRRSARPDDPGQISAELEIASEDLRLCKVKLEHIEEIMAPIIDMLLMLGVTRRKANQMLLPQHITKLVVNPHAQIALTMYACDLLHMHYLGTSTLAKYHRLGAMHRCIQGNASIPAITPEGCTREYRFRPTEQEVDRLVERFGYVRLDDYFMQEELMTKCTEVLTWLRDLMQTPTPDEMHGAVWPEADKDQRAALALTTRACGILMGEGGVGKTELITKLVRPMVAAADRFHIVGCAFVGAAVRNLKSVLARAGLGHIQCMTLHALVGNDNGLPGKIIEWLTEGQVSGTDRWLVLIVDEAFTAGVGLLNTLRKQLRMWKVAVYFLGDPGQLTPPDEYPLLTGLVSRELSLGLEVYWEKRWEKRASWLHTYVLTQNHRVADSARELLAVTRKIRDGRQPVPNRFFQVTPDAEVLSEATVQEHRITSFNDISRLAGRFTVLASTRAEVGALNRQMRDQLNPLAHETWMRASSGGDDEPNAKRQCFANDDELRFLDPVMVTKNHRITGIGILVRTKAGPPGPFVVSHYGSGQQEILGTYDTLYSGGSGSEATRVYNGDMGVLVHVTLNGKTEMAGVLLEDGYVAIVQEDEPEFYDEADVSIPQTDGILGTHLVPGYARTVHKAQGMQAQTVHIRGTKYTSRQIVYTAVSRAINLVRIADNSTDWLARGVRFPDRVNIYALILMLRAHDEK